MPLPIAADYPEFFQILWTTLMFFLFVAWIWVLISVLSDIFRRHDMGGVVKALWVFAMIFVPFLGVLIYLIAYGNGMAKRNAQQVIEAQKHFDDHVKAVAGGTAGEIERAKGLLDSGAITQAEFDQIKAKALAS